jgi:hypothetical protein
MNDMPHKGVIVVDLDGTICEHSYPAFGEPIAGVQEALQRLKDAGFWIIIHTVRTSSYYSTIGEYSAEVNSPQAVSAYLKRHQIPYDDIWMYDKPVAMAYIDDRGLRLVGDRHKSNWKKIVDTLLPGEPRLREPRKWRLWW